MTTFDSTPVAHPVPVGNTGAIAVHVPAPSSFGVGLGASDGLVGSVSVSAVDDITEGVAVVLDLAARTPVLNAAKARDPTHVDATFSEPMTFAGALLDPAQWATNSPLLKVVSVRKTGPMRARLTVTEMLGGAAYTVTAPAAATSLAGLVVDGVRRSARLVGLGGRPSVASVERLTPTRLRVHFSEPMALTAALRSPSSYALTPTDGGASVFVGRATPDPFAEGQGPPTFVDLDVTEQTSGRSYSFVASTVTDVAGNLVTAATTPVTGVGSAPAIFRLVAVSKNRVDVVLDRPVRRTTDAVDPSRYAWDNGLATVSVIGVEKNVVRLVTTDQEPGTVYTLTISPSFSDSWSAISPQAAQVGVPYSFSPTYNNPDGDHVVFSVVGTLPTGVTVNDATAVLSGTPSASASPSLRMRSTHDDATTTDSAAFTLQAWVLPTITSVPDQSATQDSFFSFTPSVTNPSGLTLSWTLQAGTLPSGFTLNGGTGNVSGTDAGIETQAGIVLRASFTTVDGVTHHVDSNAFQIAVAPALLSPPNVASGAGFNPASWYSARSMDGALNAGFIDGQNAPSTWKDLGADAHDAVGQNIAANLTYRATGGPGGKPCVEWVSQIAGGNPAACYKAAFAPETAAAMTIGFVFKGTRTGEIEVLCSGVDDFPGGANTNKFNIEQRAGSTGIGAFRGSAQLDETVAPTFPMTAFGWALVEFNGASSRVIFSDGVTQSEVTGDGGNGTTNENYWIGTYNGRVGSLSFLGKIEDIVVYKGVSPTLRGQFKTYLDQKVAGA